ncbi:alkylation response protein AidB-like acyl-CoA dehydrogenase [Jatrophihabitans sp. GAS493]|uniref:acyl-CoA dehydrogenase family protein n=1 Tax=Jatrophihabitans sp. GAS493 TaxID=1907575 RepID=UPI000BB7EA02|nr:acyl-CoA dehydrogenase family protein [Jatrophihabitans sp. GAS493]SOD71817.1 alkylation response protein AidB-like acyl-CoA dehydrogenase [Jatrophihabitans sp. GAS493]
MSTDSGIRAAMRVFIDEEVIPAERELRARDDNSAQVLARLQRSAKAQGLWALGHPTEIGGGGMGFYDFALVNEIIGRSSFGQLAAGTLSMQDSIMLHRFGSSSQRQRWLEPLVAGEILPSTGMTEPEVAGSDPTLIQATARLDGDEWVIDAHKWFTTGGASAAFTTIFARTESADVEAHRALSAIIVPVGTPGMELVRVLKTMGSTDGEHCEIQLTGVRVPAENLLGERGEGFSVGQTRLGPGRIFHCMRWLGQAQRAFELMCERAKHRYAHGSLLSEKGEIQRYIAESAAQIHAARLMILDAARQYDLDGQARVQISIVKFWAAQMLHDVIDRAIQVHGALGVTDDTPLEQMYREARYARIYDGPDEVHRMVVARRLLKDPSSAPWLQSDGHA